MKNALRGLATLLDLTAPRVSMKEKKKTWREESSRYKQAASCSGLAGFILAAFIFLFPDPGSNLGPSVTFDFLIFWSIFHHEVFFWFLRTNRKWPVIAAYLIGAEFSARFLETQFRRSHPSSFVTKVSPLMPFMHDTTVLSQYWSCRSMDFRCALTESKTLFSALLHFFKTLFYSENYGTEQRNRPIPYD